MDTHTTLVVLDDGCPETTSHSPFKFSCKTALDSSGQGLHASLILKSFVNVHKHYATAFTDIVFINITDADGHASDSSIAEGLRLARELDPKAINISYSMTQEDEEIEILLSDLSRNNVDVFSSYSNLFFEENSYPASSSFVVGVKTGKKSLKQFDKTVVLSTDLVQEASSMSASTSTASIVALALNSYCEEVTRSARQAASICSILFS